MKNKFNIGEEVTLKSDIHKYKRLITGILFRPKTKMYYLSLGEKETIHYEMELDTDKNHIKPVSGFNNCDK